MSEQVKRHVVAMRVPNDSPFRQTGDSTIRVKNMEVVLASDYDALQAECERMTEALSNANQSSGAEAYSIACEELEAYQSKRAEAGKDTGTQCSLVDGMGSLFEMLDASEAECERLQANIARLSANPADHRYWEGRYRDEAKDNEQLREEIKETAELGLSILDAKSSWRDRAELAEEKLAALKAQEPVSDLIGGQWYWVQIECGNELHTTPAQYRADGYWESSEFAGFLSDHLKVLSHIKAPAVNQQLTSDAVAENE